ncbi:hypothetical protein SADUNF_Sadunf12G0029600 [Salix dunnii]|uniref:Uncharacterized protein n=1 Tax=Salix dunnii TaxID=1413687 RepID=A0A835JHD7_9ROSI|nr:hypothetical protein SADUNF_Sadunf12G0029600 [Salix dunnii]
MWICRIGKPPLSKLFISQKIYEPYIKEVSLFRGCSLGFIKQISFESMNRVYSITFKHGFFVIVGRVVFIHHVYQAIRVHEEFFLPGEVIIEQGHVADQLYVVCHVGDNKRFNNQKNLNSNYNRNSEEVKMIEEKSFSSVCKSITHLGKFYFFATLLSLIQYEFENYVGYYDLILDIYFSDGRIILNNLLEGKDANLRNELLESNVTLSIEKSELELAMRSYGLLPVYRWGNTPLDEARIGGSKDLIKLLEAARASQIADDMQRMKYTVFPFHPWDPKEKRRDEVVLWVPQTIEELVKASVEQLKSPGGYILSENGGKILDVNMISHDQKLFLVDK